MDSRENTDRLRDALTHWAGKENQGLLGRVLTRLISKTDLDAPTYTFSPADTRRADKKTVVPDDAQGRWLQIVPGSFGRGFRGEVVPDVAALAALTSDHPLRRQGSFVTVTADPEVIIAYAVLDVRDYSTVSDAFLDVVLRTLKASG